MCNSLNKVHSYLAHPLFAPVQVGMRASGDFFRQHWPSLYQLLLLKPPEYSHIFFVICIVFKFMHNYFVHVIIDLLTLLGLLKGWTLHPANWLLTRSCLVHAGELRVVRLNYDRKNLFFLPYGMSEQLRIFSATGPNTVFLCCPVFKLNGRAGKISVLGLWGRSVWIQADICRSGASSR